MPAKPNPEDLRRQRAAVAEKALLYGTFGLLLFLPLAFGAVEPWSIFLIESGSAALFFIWIVKQTLDGELKMRGNPVFLPMGSFRPADYFPTRLPPVRVSARHNCRSRFSIFLTLCSASLPDKH